MSRRKNEAIAAQVELTRSERPTERRAALRDMCPCRVQKEIGDFWARIIEMKDDESPIVRYQVLHSLCDGSPVEMEETVIEILNQYRNDSDAKIKRAARRVLTSYARTGKWNIL